MNMLSDAIRLRDAIIAERRAEAAAKANAGIVNFPAPVAGKDAPGTPKSAGPRRGFFDRLREIACL